MCHAFCTCTLYLVRRFHFKSNIMHVEKTVRLKEEKTLCKVKFTLLFLFSSCGMEENPLSSSLSILNVSQNAQ